MYKHAAENSAPSKSTGHTFISEVDESPRGGNLTHSRPSMAYKKERKDIHSFNTHPKPPYGSQIQCGNMLQNIQRHPKVSATRSSFQGRKVGKESRSHRYLRLAMAAKRRRRPSIPSIPIQSLHMGPKYNVETCCKIFSAIQKYWHE